MIPEGWSACVLDDVAHFMSGGTPSKQNDDYWGGRHPWVSAKDLKVHYLTSSIDTLTTKGFATAKIASAGATLVLVRGMTLLKDFPVGFATRDMAFNQDIKALLPSNQVDPLFLSYALLSNKQRIRQLVNVAGHGTGRIDTEQLKCFPFDLPPLPEQKKIAQILSTWDKAIATVEKLIANSQQKKKALMQQLLTGKKRFAGFDGEWKEVRLEMVAKIVMGSSPSSKAYNDNAVGLPLIQGNADIKKRKSAPRLFTTEITKECDVGDILLSVRAPVGEVSISIHHACIGRGIASIKSKNPQQHNFLYQWLLWHEPRWASLSQGSTFSAVNSNDLRSVPILLPSGIKEQQKLASVLSSADREVGIWQQELAHLKQEKKALMQQLLTGKRRVVIDA